MPIKNFLFRVLSLVTLVLFLNPMNSKAQTFTEQASISLAGITSSYVAWGDYDNDGDLDLFLAGFNNSSVYGYYCYLNNGNNSFTNQTGTGLSALKTHSITMCDFNRDGYLDIGITGKEGTVTVSKVYMNNKDKTFLEQTGINLTGVGGGSIKWGDYNNDGNLDILLSGNIYTGGIVKIYKNNGDNTFTEQISIPYQNGGLINNWIDYNNDGLLDLQLGTSIYKNNGNDSFTLQSGISLILGDSFEITWGDYNNDGYPDILASSNNGSKVYKNNGDNTFTLQTGISLPSVTNGSVNWGDYDNDGWLDILITGRISTDNRIAKVYHNNSDNSFTELTDFTMEKVEDGTADLIDYDNDGDLDILLTGDNGSEYVTKLYKNNTINGTAKAANDSPIAPGNLNILNSSNGAVTFSWDKASDTETPQNGLSYNLYVYNVDSTSYFRSPQAFPQTDTKNGFCLTAQRGSIQYNASGYTLKGLPTGLYKWSVQAVDGGLKGGAFATEASFAVVNLNDVAVNVAGGVLTGTAISMAYSTNTTDGSDGTWIDCTGTTTTVDFATGGFDIWVRERANTTNTLMVANIPTQITPSFTIDYTNERTTQIISDNVEYSTNADLSGATLGSGAKLELTPGQDIYFRIKASISCVISAIQTLTVPNRPAPPSFAIDYINEKTNEPISSLYEYSSNASMSSVISGAGVALNIAPGQVIYFRLKETTIAFKSEIQMLTASARPSAPVYTIDFIAETTSEVFPSTDEYSGNSWSTSWNGTGAKLVIYPSSTYAFRTKATTTAFRSQIFTMYTPDRPVAPTNPIINDGNNTFDWTYTAGFTSPTDYQYSLNGGTDWSDCVVKPISVGNGIIAIGKVQVRVKSTVANFRGIQLQSSNPYTLIPESFEEAGIRCYPNPTSNVLVIEGVPDRGVVNIYTVNGQLLKTVTVETGLNRIGVNELPKGVYIFKIQVGETIAQTRVVKE